MRKKERDREKENERERKRLSEQFHKLFLRELILKRLKLLNNSGISQVNISDYY